MPTTDSLHVLDLSALWAMESDFDDAEPVRNFVRDFITIWEDRYARLLDASANRDRAAILEVLMGIKVSSVMIGAVQLRTVAEDIEQCVRRGPSCVPDSMLITLHDCGDRTIAQLNKTYLKSGPA